MEKLFLEIAKWMILKAIQKCATNIEWGKLTEQFLTVIKQVFPKEMVLDNVQSQFAGYFAEVARNFKTHDVLAHVGQSRFHELFELAMGDSQLAKLSPEALAFAGNLVKPVVVQETVKEEFAFEPPKEEKPAMAAGPIAKAMNKIKPGKTRLG